MADSSLPLLQEVVPCSRRCYGAKVFLLLSLLIGLGFTALLAPVPGIHGWGEQHPEHAITMVDGPLGFRASRFSQQPHHKAVAMSPQFTWLSGSQAAPALQHASWLTHEKGFKAEPYVGDSDVKSARVVTPAIAQAPSMGLGRRGTLAAALVAALAPSHRTAAATDAYDTYTTMPGAVIPAKTTAQYVATLRSPRFDEAEKALTDLVESEKYYEAANAMLLDDFDSIRQSCYFLPYALMKEGDTKAGMTMQAQYEKVKDKLEAFDMVMQKAERSQATEPEVKQALDNVFGQFRTYRDVALNKR